MSDALIETVVTTTGSDGVVNCAAMGVRWGEDELVFWPFHATRTLRNLRVHGEAVVHLTDDVLLFVQAALGHPRPPTRPATAIDGAVIEDVQSWREVVVRRSRPLPASYRARACEPGSWPRVRAPRSRSGCAAPGTPWSRRRSSRRGCGGSVASRCRPSSPGFRSSSTRPPDVREREAMDYVRRYVAERT